AMLASAAIPGLFPPRQIDNTLLADGGLRDQVFLSSVETVRENLARASGRDVRVSATLIVNGAVRPPDVAADDSILGYARRGALILADEVLRKSIEDVVRFAEAQPGWSIRGVIADTDLSACGSELASGTFDPCVTTTLFDDGRKTGAATPLPWLDPDALLVLAGAL
ncbi:MAG: patatin-like phospholipase family protein, partial [Pseudomonadota bacterium]